MAQSYPPDVAEFIRDEIASGVYTDESTMVVEGLRALQVLRQKHEELKAEVQERIRRARAGVSTPLDFDEFKRECAKRLAAEKRQS